MTDSLLAPGGAERAAYLKQVATGNQPGCRLCGVLAGPDGHQVLMRGEWATLIMNKFPYAVGHLMVVLNRHTGDINLKLYEAEAVHLLLALGCRALDAVYHPDGYNIGLNVGKAAGQSVVDHLHWHLVPRMANDVNFITVTADTRVINETVAESYAKLKAVVNRV